MHQDRQPIHTGGCQCGNIRYALYAEPLSVNLCHCRMCQRAVGNAFAALAVVPQADFAWTAGAPGWHRSSSWAERGFCRDCGTPLAFHAIDSGRIDLTVGSLDDPNAVPPTFNYGVESRVGWVHGISDLPDYETGSRVGPGDGG